MDNNKILKKNTDKVNLIMLIISIFGGIINFITIFTDVNKILVSKNIYLVITAIAALIFITKKYRPYLRYIYFINNLVLALLYLNYNSNKSSSIIIYAFVFSLAYFDKTLIVAAALVTLIGNVITFSIYNINLDINELVEFISITIFTAFISYYISKTGKDLILSASNIENKFSSNFEKLKETFISIRETNKMLNQEILNANNNMSLIKNSSFDTKTSIEQMNKGVTEQTESIYKINENMAEVADKVKLTFDFAIKTTDLSKSAKGIVNDSDNRIKQMEHQIKIIDNTNLTSVNTVKEFQNNIKKINEFLSSITSIAEQTNLLALNASIEASRAGEAGKGFAVVSREIKDLSFQTSSIANEVNDIIEELESKSLNILKSVEKGNKATNEGKQISDDVNKSFNKLRESFDNINNYIENELNLISESNDKISSIHIDIENISSISEEQAASSEELFAIIENQSTEVQNLVDSMDKIIEVEKNLEKVISN